MSVRLQWIKRDRSDGEVVDSGFLSIMDVSQVATKIDFWISDMRTCLRDHDEIVGKLDESEFTWNVGSLRDLARKGTLEVAVAKFLQSTAK